MEPTIDKWEEVKINELDIFVNGLSVDKVEVEGRLESLTFTDAVTGNKLDIRAGGAEGLKLFVLKQEDEVPADTDEGESGAPNVVPDTDATPGTPALVDVADEVDSPLHTMKDALPASGGGSQMDFATQNAQNAVGKTEAEIAQEEIDRKAAEKIAADAAIKKASDDAETGNAKTTQP